MGKKRVLWGCGKICEEYLSKYNDSYIAFIIDNNRAKAGTIFCGIPVLHPSKIIQWDSYEILIVLNSKNSNAVAEQLEQYGLIEGKNYKIWRNGAITPVADVSIEVVKNVLKEIVFSNEENETEFETLFHTKDEYEKIEKYSRAIMFEDCLDKIYSKLPKRRGVYRGFCECCKEEVDFLLDYMYSDNKPVWRERAVCPKCGCNSRMRYIIGRALRDDVKSNDKKIYLYERVTNSYQVFLKYVPNLIGSEYLGDDKIGGMYYDGIRHENAMQLSFESDSMDMLISMDVFEHVADYNRAFSEAHRVLKKGGKLLFTVPIHREQDITTDRAEINANGEIVYLKEPRYHGNPLSEEGSLVFHDFGWDLINILKKHGFSEAYYITYFSVSKAYFGYLPLAIEAVK